MNNKNGTCYPREQSWELECHKKFCNHSKRRKEGFLYKIVKICCLWNNDNNNLSLLSAEMNFQDNWVQKLEQSWT